MNILESPEDLFYHIKKEAGAVILRITYGYTPNARGADPLVDLAEKTMRDLGIAAVPGKWSVDVLPFCKSSIFHLSIRTVLTLAKYATYLTGAQALASKP
jgi:hypothetical protein